MAEVKGVWVFNEVLDLPETSMWAQNMVVLPDWRVTPEKFEYTDLAFNKQTLYAKEDGWLKENTVDFSAASTSDFQDDFYEWLVANAVPYEEWIANQKYTIKHGTLTAIGDAIRGKLNTDTQYTPTEMPQAIEEIGNGGSYDQGYTDGQQAEYDRFWDSYQTKGNRTNYYELFSKSGWNDTTFKPKYPINCSGTQSYHSTNASLIFYNCSITEILIPITVTGLPMSQTFHNCAKLVTISKLVLNGVTEFTNTFSYCSKLKNITIEGSIDVNFNISATAVLTNESVQSIIDHLKDLTGQTAQKLTFHATVGGKLTDEQKATITAKNWTLVY